MPGARTLTDAIGHGKRAARAMDAWMAGHRLVTARPDQLATLEHLNTWYYADAPRGSPRLDTARRTSTFDEVVGGLDESTALFEARRCMSCGNCFQCDNCFGVCPDNAVMKVDEAHGYRSITTSARGAGCASRSVPAER